MVDADAVCLQGRSMTATQPTPPADPPSEDRDAGLTVEAYLDEWMAVQATQIQPSTWENYRMAIRNYVVPHIGAVPLAALTIRDLNSLYAQLHACGGREDQPLKAHTVRRTHNILHKAFGDAVVVGTMATNPSHRATLPRVDRGTGDPDQERVVWDAAQLRAFLDHTVDHRFHDVWFVAAFTGMRRGEVLGLRWGDVDLDLPEPLLRVRRSLSVVAGHASLTSPKGHRPRALHLDPPTVAVIRRQRDRQAEHQRDRGPAWRNRWDLVFTDRNGRYLAPDTVSQDFRRTVLAAPVPTKRLHDLRHLHATLLLQAGVPVKVVSERLGHASTQMTMEIYAHVLPAMDADAIARFSAHVFGNQPPS